MMVFVGCGIEALRVKLKMDHRLGETSEDAGDVG
jgi:hypothetical protein